MKIREKRRKPKRRQGQREVGRHFFINPFPFPNYKKVSNEKFGGGGGGGGGAGGGEVTPCADVRSSTRVTSAGSYYFPPATSSIFLRHLCPPSKRKLAIPEHYSQLNQLSAC